MYRRKRGAALSTSQLILVLFCVIAFLFLSAFGKSTFNFSESDIVSVLAFVILISGITFLCLYFFVKKIKRDKFRKVTLQKIDNMSGVEFENYVFSLYQEIGYQVQKTPVSGDLGVDIVARKGSEKIAIQVKRYKGYVGRSAVSDAVAGMAYYKCNSCVVITNSTFSYFAKKLAYSNYCRLIDRHELLKMIHFTHT